MSKHNKHRKHKMEKDIVEEQQTQAQASEQVEIETEQPEVEHPETEASSEQLDAKRLEELQQQCADLKDKNLRMMAEFDNYRRRTSKEKLELEKTAGERIFKDMLSLVDDFERALSVMQSAEDIAAVREGVELIYQKFLGFLQKNEVEPIATVDADFDTEYHEAVTTFPAPTPELKGKVIDCTKKGYTLAGKVIRYAKVVVGE